MLNIFRESRADGTSVSHESNQTQPAGQATLTETHFLLQMLEQVPVNVMRARMDDFIIDYANKSTIDELRRLEAHIPIKADELVGSSIDIFHKNPTHQRTMLSNESNLPHKAVITLADELLELNVWPIEDENGECTHAMVTWSVITDQVSLARSVHSVTDEVATQSNQLSSSATVLLDQSDSSTQLSTDVAAAAEEASVNVSTVASAVEELDASVQEIAAQIETATTNAQDTNSKAEVARNDISGFAEVAAQVESVVTLISDIASQTNLLALNATIEAARAGEHGKGFAVVASEVKNLATQTASATDEVSNKINEMQSATAGIVTSIQEISTSIQSTLEIFNTIAAAVQEQSAATAEIARNASEAAQGTNEISSKITTVAETVQSTQGQVETVQGVGDQMKEIACRLQADVKVFMERLGIEA